MKAVILAGGLGTRMSEEAGVRPKPMVEIGGKPILWHIMKLYSMHGIDDFVVCCGFKGQVIKEYFLNCFVNCSDLTVDLKHNDVQIHNSTTEPWRVTLIDTGENTMTGGRIRRIREHISDETFCLTYGDGLSDINIAKLVQFHHDNGGLATLTAVQAPGRFGAFAMPAGRNLVSSFHEKPDGDGAWVNGGFFVLEPQALNYIEGDDSIWEQAPLETLARDGRLVAFRHRGFWQPMDTLHDRDVLQSLWESDNAPWRMWQ